MKLLNDGQLKSAFNAFRNTKLRNFWTMLGVIIGVTSFILVVGISEGVKLQILGQVQHIGSDILTIRPNNIQISGSSLDSLTLLSGINVSGSLSPNDLSRVANTKGVKEVVPMSAMTAQIKGSGGSYKKGLVIGTTPNFDTLLNQGLSYGNFLNSTSNMDNQVVVGSQAAIDLFNEDVPLGQTVLINNQPFVVRGILDPFPATPLSSGAEFNKALFISYGNSEQMTNNTVTTYEILALPNDPSQALKVQKNIESSLLASHGGQYDFRVLNQDQNLKSSTAILDLVTKLVIGVSAISLLVGGIGIMNVMLVSITERTHEIGIRKALGATNRQILEQFLVESTTLSFIGGLIGVILAYIIDLVLRLFTDIEPSISVTIIILALIISTVIGVIFGSIPAFKAAKKEPIDALRSE